VISQEIRRRAMCDRDASMEVLEKTIIDLAVRLQCLTQCETERVEADRQAKAARAQLPPEPKTLGEYLRFQSQNRATYQVCPSPIPPVAPKKSPELIDMENKMIKIRELFSKVQALDQTPKMTETQVAQNAPNTPKTLDVLPSHPEENPKGQISAISLRSDKQL
jgi:hypothetical protein